MPHTCSPCVGIRILKKQNDDLKKKMEDERVAAEAQRVADQLAWHKKHSMVGWSLFLRIILLELLNRILVLASLVSFGIRLKFLCKNYWVVVCRKQFRCCVVRSYVATLCLLDYGFMSIDDAFMHFGYRVCLFWQFINGLYRFRY